MGGQVSENDQRLADTSAAQYLASLRDAASGGFRFAAHQPPTVMATCYAVLALESVGGLVGLEDAVREGAAKFIRAAGREDGSFADPLFDDGGVAGEHDRAYFDEETTTFAQQALDALGEPPPVERPWAELLPEAPAVGELFGAWPWRNAWLDSNRVMFVLGQLCHDAVRHRRPELYALVDAGLDWLDTHQDPQTGLWRGPHAVDAGNAMAATFHFTFFYFARRRPVRYAERIIDSCLKLQQADGLFAGPVVGHTCLDYDAVDLLAKMTLVTTHRRAEVAGALARARTALAALQNEDGGYAHAKRVAAPLRAFSLAWLARRLGVAHLAPPATTAANGDYHTGWDKLAAPTASSNPFSTWFRLLAVALAEQPQWLDAGAAPLVFRRLPFLGYHDPLAVQGAYDVVETETAAKRRVRGAARPQGSPVVSVLVPAFNAAATLGEALGDLQAQTYPHWQAIVVDDGSTDSTAAIAQRFAANDERVRVIRQANQGLAAARNAALAEATGELVHCLDADDRIEPDFFMQIVAAFEPGEAHADGRCLVASMTAFRHGGRTFRHAPPPAEDAFALANLVRANPRPPVCYVFERRILDRVGRFDETIRHCHDWDLWLRMTRAGVRFEDAHDAMAWYRIVPASLSANFVRFVNTASEVVWRQADAVAEPTLEVAVIFVWWYNLLRAVIARRTNDAQDLARWGRERFDQEGWQAFFDHGGRTQFEWADGVADCEDRAARSLEARLALLRLLTAELPVLMTMAGAQVAHDLAVGLHVDAVGSGVARRLAFAAKATGGDVFRFGPRPWLRFVAEVFLPPFVWRWTARRGEGVE
jgi:glycosyltransferase involved in cell wall biosynthesis